jgi:uncharacterized membrane-anchored protein
MSLFPRVWGEIIMKLVRLWLAALALLVLTPALVAQPAPNEAEQKAYQEQMERLANQLHPVTGDVRIEQANAVLHLGEAYYFLPADEARLILSEAWGNPPELGANVLGLVFPAGKTFMDDTWGAVITYEASGYVSDDDAQSADYNALIEQMQAGEADVNASRRASGFPAQHIVGWAQPPAYDRNTHSVIWAQNIQFEGSPENTLNYEIRLLGRNGVLSLNMITGMSKLEETRAAARSFAGAAAFEQGARYADFQPGRDRVAEYGVAGLVAAGVGATLAKKAGLLALILAFGKKGIVLILAGLAVLGGFFRRLFRGKQEEEVYEEQVYEPASDFAEVRPEAPADPGPLPGDEAPEPAR